MVTGVYKYYSAAGDLLYFKHRIEPGRKGAKKEFVFWHFKEDGSRQLGRGGEPILYNLPNVLKSKAVIFTEGEKQADILTSWGLCGTSFDSGSNSRFPAEMIPHLKGKRVAILRDNDAPGMVYAEMIAKTLHGICDGARIVLLPGIPLKGDICEWVDLGGNRAALLDIIKETPLFEYTPPLPKVEKPKREFDTRGSINGEMVAEAKSVPIESLLDFHQGYALCLWHKEDKPSLHHHAASNRAKCFACGYGADSIEVIMKREGLSFPDSVRYLCAVR
jgi:DNA primase